MSDKVEKNKTQMKHIGNQAKECKQKTYRITLPYF